MEYCIETFNKWRVHYVMAWPYSDDSYYRALDIRKIGFVCTDFISEEHIVIGIALVWTQSDISRLRRETIGEEPAHISAQVLSY